MPVHQDMFQDDIVMEMTTCQQCTFGYTVESLPQMGRHMIKYQTGQCCRKPTCSMTGQSVHNTGTHLNHYRTRFVSSHVVPHLIFILFFFFFSSFFNENCGYIFAREPQSHLSSFFHFVQIIPKQNLINAFQKQFKGLRFQSEPLILHSSLGDHHTSQSRDLAQWYLQIPR